MSKEDGIHDLTKPDPKDAMSKLNELIAMRFDEATSSNNSVSENISLKSIVEEVIASPETEINEKSLSSIAITNDISSSEANDITVVPQEQLSNVESKDSDADQKLKSKLNKLAATGFEEVSYESYEIKVEEPKNLENHVVLPKEANPLSRVSTSINTISQVPVTQPTVHHANPSHKEKQKKALVPDSAKQAQIPHEVATESTRDAGRKPIKTENVVSIIDELDSIESELKKKEVSKSYHVQAISSKKNVPLNKEETNILSSSSNAHTQKVSISDTATPAKVAMVYSEGHDAHFPKNTNIEILERPERLTRAMVYLDRSGVFGERCDLIKDKHYASDKDLLQVHSEDYIKFVRSYSASGGGFLGDSTYMTSHSFEVASLAAGAAILAAELVLSGKYSAAMAFVRPPGHHAGVDKYRGFCIFNNVAVLARYLQKKKGISKVMIIDWDAHAGDGTMEIFYNDPTVMVLSLHRDPHDFYPRRGFSSQIGEGPGKGYTANVEMPVGAGDEEYAFAFDEFVIPLLHKFSPDFIICSCGFDAYYKEPHMKLNLTSAGYHLMTKKIMSVINGNFVLVMEGGYHKFNGHLAHVVINSLLGLPDPIADTLKTTEYERNQQKAVMKEAGKKIAYVKEMLGIQD
ncbi:histone deacetylase [uncultured Methanomethylovorans sp.]|uniref:histone deacetylase family protein n=1 Tax=uncultured Methanomethylovorans sp. TaxID=183759 RepID=UPI002AA7BA04|nr:histone deacetylase [uncultured Methanomethylovorans sp.]